MKIIFLFILLTTQVLFAQILRFSRAVAYFPFVEDSKDYSYSENDGIPFDITFNNDRFNNLNSSAYFNGNSSYILINEANNLESEEFSVSFWFKPTITKTDEFQTLIMKEDGYNEGYRVIYLTHYEETSNDYAKIDFTIASELGEPIILRSNKAILDTNKWYFITACYDSLNFMKLYIDGKLDTTRQGPTSWNKAGSQELVIGRHTDEGTTHNYGGYFKGKIDDVLFFDYALNQGDILKLFENKIELFISLPEVNILPNKSNFEIPINIFIDNSIKINSKLEFILTGIDNNFSVDSVSWENSIFQQNNWESSAIVSNNKMSFSFSGTNVLPQSGEVAKIFLTKQKELTTPRELKIENLLVDSDSINGAVNNGKIKQMRTKFGDINQDNIIGYDDLNLLTYALLGTQNLSAEQKVNADITLDGTFSSLDASLLFQYLQGNISTLPDTIIGTQLQNNGQITQPSKIEVFMDEVLLPIGFDNTTDVLGFEFEIEYNSNVFDIYRIDSFFPYPMNVFAETSTNKIKFIGYSLTKNEITDKVLSLVFRKKGNVSDTTSYLLVKNIRFNEDEVINSLDTLRINLITGIKDDELIAADYRINNPYPNPFNPSTNFSFYFPQKTRLKISIYDMLGSEIKRFDEKTFSKGNHTIVWNGLNFENKIVPSGIYFVKFKSEKFSIIKKVVLLK